MDDPKKIFKDEIKKFKGNLKFKYMWVSNFEDIFQKEYDEFKDKLGRYKNLYDIKNIYYLKYIHYKNLSEKIDKIKLVSLKNHMKYSLDKKFYNINNNFILKKNNYIYKGTRYFYNEEQDKEFNNKVDYAYYGNKYIAFTYANRYNGGLQVYKLKKDIKLFNVTNDQNIINIIKKIKNKIKTDEIFFDNITYREFYKLLKIKYGININKYYQAYNIYKYLRYNDLWLYEPKYNSEEYRNSYDKSYTGWYFGAGRIDRYVATGIMKLISNEYDGICSKAGFYSPFFPNPALNELIIWNRENLKRKIKNKYDTMQYIKTLDFDPFKINFNIEYSNTNKNYKYIYFYNKSKLEHIVDKSFIKNKNNISIMSLNLNNFQVINKDDTKDFTLKKLNTIFNIYKIDICCLQNIIPYFTQKELDILLNNEYIITNNNLNNLAIIYKKSILINSIYEHNNALFFNVNNIKFCNIRLNDDNFLYRKGTLLSPKDLYNEIKKNLSIRIKILNEIINHKPNYLIGHFSFTKNDDEYIYLRDTLNLNSKLVDYTNPDNTQTDFIFSSLKYNFLSTINFPYYATLPIYTII